MQQSLKTMNPVDYLALTLALFLFRWVNNAILAYSEPVSMLYPPSDVAGQKITNFLLRLDKRFISRWLPPFYLTAISFVAWPFLKWRAVDSTYVLRNFYFFLSGIVVWKALSQSTDWYRNSRLFLEKCVLIVFWLATLYYPGFFVAWLFVAIHLLRSWTPSQQMILRMLQMFMAFLTAVAIIRSTALWTTWGPVKVQSSVALFLSIVVMASYYFVSGWAKLQLSPQWAGWIRDNQSHHLVAAAYMWGWQSSRPIGKHSRVIQWLGANEQFNQLFIVAVECAWLFALFNSTFAMILCVASIILHLNTFLKSGIFYWPSILAQAGLFASITYCTPETQSEIFNVFNGILGASIILLFPLRHKIWDPPRLALWDTPFIGRIEWFVEGMSGKTYALDSPSMGPYGRFFGGSLPSFLIPRKIFHRFLGQVATQAMRDQVIATKGDLAKLDALQELHGTQDKREDLVDAHNQFLLTYFVHYNKGRKRASLVPWWLVRAPEIYYYRHSGEESFREQERVTKVTVRYREAFFDGQKVIEVRTDLINEIDIPTKKFQL